MGSRAQSYSFPVAITVVGALLFLTYCGVCVYRYVRYDQDIGGHLKRAADANQPALAITELEKAASNMDDWGLCSSKETDVCYTSVIYRTPDEDVGFWRTNLDQTLQDLRDLPPDADHLVISNTLLKVRETLVDHKGSSGVTVTDPDGITLYPHNTGFALWGLGSLLMLLFGCGWWWVAAVS